MRRVLSMWVGRRLRSRIVIGCVSLTVVHSTTPIWLIGVAVMFVEALERQILQ